MLTALGIVPPVTVITPAKVGDPPVVIEAFEEPADWNSKSLPENPEAALTPNIVPEAFQAEEVVPV